MAIDAVGSDVAVARHEAGPNGGQREEDADDGVALGREFWDVFVELEAGENCW